MPIFEFATAGRIVFGEGSVGQVPAAAASLGKRVLLVTGATPERAAPLRQALSAAGLSVADFAVPGEPTVDLVRRAPRDCDVVVACGGGRHCARPWRSSL
ncbi:MAG: iron-containing alcohol dehydrogenase, partial [Candidatus Solibacter sp.]